jgi:hypothetical protein
MGGRFALACMALLGCGRLADDGAVDAGFDGPGADASPRCDPAAPFGNPAPLTEIDTPTGEWAFRLTPDELTAVFVGGPTLFITTRASRTDPFAPPKPIALQPLPQAPNVLDVTNPSITADGLSVYFECSIDAQIGSLCVVQRPDTSAPFGPITKLSYPCWNDSLQLGTPVCGASISGDGLRLFLVAPGGVYVASHASLTADFQPNPTQIFSGDARTAAVTNDEITLFAGMYDEPSHTTSVGTATRATTASAFGATTPVDGIPVGDAPTWASADRCRLYIAHFESDGKSRIYVASR